MEQDAYPDSSKCPGRWGRIKTEVLFAVALITSLLWYLFWVTMTPVEKDISKLVNWYFFMRFDLKEVYNFYDGFWAIGRWSPLVVVVSYVLAKLIHYPILHRLQQVICVVMAVFNTLLFIYLSLAGGKIVTLFTVMLPLQSVMLMGHSWWIFLLIPTTSVILYYIFCQCPSVDKNVNQKRNYIIKSCRTPCKSIILGFLILLGLHATAALILKWIVDNGCLACDSTPNQELPKKPYLIAHRGCSFLFPENSLAAFREAVKLPNIEGIETDVQISLDGVPFLLHDPHLIRTTDARSRCPTISPHNNASWLNFSSGSCPLQEIDVGVWFGKKFKDQKLPMLSEYLEVAKNSGKIVIFDIWKPNVEHPFHTTYINQSLDVLVSSGVPLDKVWWLMKENREWVYKTYPDMIQATKTEDTKFEDFGKEHIQKVNDDWTIPLSTFRMYQAANISLNMFFVDSTFMYNYAWCIGVESVTTNNCLELSQLQDNSLYQVCRELWHIEDKILVPLTVTLVLCSLSCMTCFEFLRKQKWKNTKT